MCYMHYVPFIVLFSATRATVVFMDTDRGFKGGAFGMHRNKLGRVYNKGQILIKQRALTYP